MELDARRLPDGSRLETDVCVIGAGPAGIAVAREFLGFDIDVLLLESGGPEPDEWPQTLNEGAVVGHEYVGLRSSRHRQVGGVAPIWNTRVTGHRGAKYVPLDPWDFDPPAGPNRSTGWPIRLGDLDPFYRRAQTVCGLGPYRYDGADWADPNRPPLDIPGDTLCTRVYQFGRGQPFTAIYPDQFRASANLRLCVYSTVCRLSAEAGGKRVVEALIGSPDGRRHTVRASTFVLAGGAVENARLLLVSDLGNTLVGRCFMEHPRDRSLSLVPATDALYARAAFYDAHQTGDGSIVAGRLGLAERAVRTLGFPNASLTLLPRLRRENVAGRLLGRLARAFQRDPDPPERGGHGWSKRPHPARVFDGFMILVNLEQRPRPENRIELGGGCDALGIPRPVLHWGWRSEDQAELARLHAFLITSLESAGLGRVEADPASPIDLNAHHHAGTTRMAEDPRHGVVDADGLVHGTRNLFVAGASVFPTAGFANPTLTVVAMAIRLADHLKARG